MEDSEFVGYKTFAKSLRRPDTEDLVSLHFHVLSREVQARRWRVVGYDFDSPQRVDLVLKAVPDNTTPDADQILVVLVGGRLELAFSMHFPR
ncbi:hypothetical protein KC845_00365 [Candidatus Kaiserbacteria bacterium]|nr:hypothetical protein [Candidatus Kaiserbacteria bacterium]